LIGFGALATDVGRWYGEQRTAQAIVDSAAIAAALEIGRDHDEATAILAARADAERNGFETSYGTLSLAIPASSGPFKDQDGTIEAVVQMNVQGFLSAVFFGDEISVTARDVARTIRGATCVWVMDTSAKSALVYSGMADVVLNCGISVKSNHAQAITRTGTNACFAATEIAVVGGVNGECITPTPVSGVPAETINDPLSYLPPPSYEDCDYASEIIGDVAVMSPGVYCGNITLNSSADVTMEPGIYVFDDANFKVNAGGILNGNGVMLYTTQNGGRIVFNGGSAVDLSAPTSGPYTGILIYADRNGDPKTRHLLAGGATMQLDGTVYAPTQQIDFAGGSSSESVSAMIIGRTVGFVGNSEVQLEPATVLPAALLDPVLVE